MMDAAFKEHRMWSITKCAAGLVCVVVFTGCYEEIEPQQSQQQTTQTPPKEGPISGQVSQGGGSALGGAKRAATNIVREAEEKSQRTAREADPNAPATPANDEP
jgi:hypothetical protein